MKCIKKLVALTLAAVLALAMLTACGGGVSNEAAINADMEKTLFTMINAEREARGKKKIEVRLKDAEKAYEETVLDPVTTREGTEFTNQRGTVREPNKHSYLESCFLR